MEWIEVKIYTTRQGIEPVSAALLETGITGIQIEDYDELVEYLNESSKYWDYFEEDLLNKSKKETSLKVYVSDNPYGQEILLNIKQQMLKLKNLEKEINIDLGTLLIETTDNLNDEAWLNKWKEYYKPFPVGEKVIIKPVWEKDIDNVYNKIVFNINPGHIFGTGLHQTTKLCIEQLEKYVNDETFVLDIGCGTGILSIISLLLGAKKAMAIDIDENAVKVAYENANINKIDKDKYFVTSGNIIDDLNLQNNIENNKYDIVVANIIADVICNITNIVFNKLSKNGVFIASGIIKDRINDVYDALLKSGFDIICTNFKDEWACIVSKIK